MNDFKQGDIIRGLSNRYAFTNRDMTEARVISINKNHDEMLIEIITHLKYKGEEGRRYNVCNSSMDFALVSKIEPKTQADINSLLF